MAVPSHEAIAAAIVTALSTHGPLSGDELSDVLVAEGIDLGPDPHDLLEDVIEDDPGPIMSLSDERWVWLPAVLDGRVFTHRLSAAEAEHDMVFVDADLAPLSLLTELPTYQHLTDGSSVADVSPFLDEDVLAERGWPRVPCPQRGRCCSSPDALPAWTSLPATWSDCESPPTVSSSLRCKVSRRPASP